MIAQDYFAHVSPAGETPVQRIQSTTDYLPGPKVGYVIGENLAWGTLYLATPKAIVEAWIASPAHLANILESRYRETGSASRRASPPHCPAASRRNLRAGVRRHRPLRPPTLKAGIVASIRYSAMTRERRWS